MLAYLFLIIILIFAIIGIISTYHFVKTLLALKKLKKSFKFPINNDDWFFLYRF